MWSCYLIPKLLNQQKVPLAILINNNKTEIFIVDYLTIIVIYAAHQLYYAMSGIVKPDVGRSFKLPRKAQHVVCYCEKAICFVGSFVAVVVGSASMCLFIYQFFGCRSWRGTLLRGDSAAPFSSLRSSQRLRLLIMTSSLQKMAGTVDPTTLSPHNAILQPLACGNPPISFRSKYW